MAEAHDVSKHVKLYMGVFVALAVFTVITVLASLLKVNVATHVVIAMFIACIKGGLVAAIFMHLKWEKAATLWGVFLICAIFFVVLLAIPSLVAGDLPPQAKVGTWG